MELESRSKGKTPKELDIVFSAQELEDAILKYLKEQDMTGWNRYFNDYYVKEFRQKGLQVDQEKLWDAINSLAESNRVQSLKANFYGEEGVVITLGVPRKRVPTEESRGKIRRSPYHEAGISGKLSREEYEKIREKNRLEQKRQLRGANSLWQEPDPY